MNKLNLIFTSLLLSGNLFITSAQKTFYTCHEISVDEFYAWHEALSPIVVIDIRTKTEYLDKHIKNAIWASSDSAIISVSDTLDADQKIIIYDTSGNESLDACLLLASKGKQSVFHVKNGFEEWEKLGHMVVKTIPKNK